MRRPALARILLVGCAIWLCLLAAMLVLYYPRTGTVGASPILMTLVPNPFWVGRATGDAAHPFDIDLKVIDLLAMNAAVFAVLWLVARLIARRASAPGLDAPVEPTSLQDD